LQRKFHVLPIVNTLLSMSVVGECAIWINNILRNYDIWFEEVMLSARTVCLMWMEYI